jgi:hypothetical protein
MSEPDYWNLRCTRTMKRQIDPLAAREGLAAADYARRLLTLAVRERLAQEFGGGNATDR